MNKKNSTILIISTVIFLIIITLIAYLKGIKTGIFYTILLLLFFLYLTSIVTALNSIYQLTIYTLTRRFKKSLLLLAGLVIFFSPLFLVFKINHENGKLTCKINKENLIKIYNCKNENLSLTGKLFCQILPDTKLLGSLGFETKKLILKGETLNNFQPIHIDSEKKVFFPPEQIYETRRGLFKVTLFKNNASFVLTSLNPLNITQANKNITDTNLLNLIHWDSEPSKKLSDKETYKNKRRKNKGTSSLQGYALQTSLENLEKSSIAVFIRAPFFLILALLQVLASIPLLYLRVVKKREEFFQKARLSYLMKMKEITDREIQEENRQPETENGNIENENIEEKRSIKEIRGIKTLLAHVRKKKIKKPELSKTNNKNNGNTESHEVN